MFTQYHTENQNSADKVGSDAQPSASPRGHPATPGWRGCQEAKMGGRRKHAGNDRRLGGNTDKKV